MSILNVGHVVGHIFILPYIGKRELADRDGLLIRITPKASISFYYRFSWQGKQVRFKISSYLEMSLVLTLVTA
ncbi:MAG: Arm DNA-binding domain-containing protein [Colwellia sp.]